MTGLERVFAALGGEKPDHPPYGFVTGSLGARLAGVDAAAAFRDPEAYLLGQTALQDIYDPDIVFTPFVFAYEALAYGGELAPQKGGSFNLKKPPFGDIASAINAMGGAGDPIGAEGVAYLVESARLIAGRFGDRSLVVAPIVAPVDLPALLIGIEAWLDALLFALSDAGLLAGRCIGHFASMAAAYAAAGARALACPCMFINPAILDPKNVEKLIVPVMERCYSLSPLPIVAHHGGNPLVPYLGLYSRFQNVAGFAIGDRESYLAARLAIGPARLILASVPRPAFEAFTPDSLRHRLSRIASTCDGDAAWGLVNSGAELSPGTPEGLLSIVREVMRASA